MHQATENLRKCVEYKYAAREAAQLLERRAYTIDEAVLVSGVGRTSIYEVIKKGELRAVKRGRRTLILTDDLERFLTQLKPMGAANADRT